MANLNNLIVNGESRFVGGIYGNLTGNAATATKATQDGSGNTITSTYATIAKTYDDTTNTTYRGMRGKDGANNAWVRTTTQGIIPYQAGGAGAGHCGLGTSTWYFASAYIDNIYGNLRTTNIYGNSSTIQFKSGISGHFNEGIRIQATSSWSEVVLCGNENTGLSGTSANTWNIGNNNGNFYITRNGASSGSAILKCVSNVWQCNGGMSATSDKNLKSNFSDVHVLNKLKKMHIQSWKFNRDKIDEQIYNFRLKDGYDVAVKPTYTKGTKDEPLHIGPVAQEFNLAYGLNNNETDTINYTDSIGVALRAIQELAEQVDNLKREVRMYKNILGITKEQIREYKDNYAIKLLEKEQLRQKRLENNNSEL